MNNIPFLNLGKVNEPYFERFAAATERIIRSGRYIGGEDCTSFETKLAETVGCKYCVGVSNGLDALKLIIEGYKALGIFHAGDEIIAPANTYVASILAISEAGLVPVLVEPDIDTMNIDSTQIEAAVTDRTRGIMTVHLYGRVAYDTSMAEIATKYGLKIIEDNAQAIGAVSEIQGTNSDKAGGLGDAAAFSFYPTKNIGALGDAGAVTTSDKDLADAVRAIANYGSDRRYHNIYIGYNCRLDPIQAAILSIKLDDLGQISEHRQAIATVYDKKILNPKVKKPEIPAFAKSHVWHQYVIRTEKRDELRQFLTENGIGSDINYPTPPHLQPCYINTLGKKQFPIAEQISKTCLSLPISNVIDADTATIIAEVLNNY